jgi:hypothetical protein
MNFTGDHTALFAKRERTVRELVAVTVALLALAGCAPTYTSKPQPPAPPPPQARMIGMSKLALLACAGTPVQTSAKEDVEYLTYVTGSRRPTDGQPPQSSAAPTAAAGGPGYCRVTFGLRRSVVESVTFAGQSVTDLAMNTDCLRIVNKCLAVR